MATGTIKGYVIAELCSGSVFRWNEKEKGMMRQFMESESFQEFVQTLGRPTFTKLSKMDFTQLVEDLGFKGAFDKKTNRDELVADIVLPKIRRKLAAMWADGGGIQPTNPISMRTSDPAGCSANQMNTFAQPQHVTVNYNYRQVATAYPTMRPDIVEIPPPPLMATFSPTCSAISDTEIERMEAQAISNAHKIKNLRNQKIKKLCEALEQRYNEAITFIKNADKEDNLMERENSQPFTQEQAKVHDEMWEKFCSVLERLKGFLEE